MRRLEQSERARLDALADQFARDGVHVEVIYGATDDGDPWCVVKDASEEVLANGHGVVTRVTFTDPGHDPSDLVLVSVGHDLSYSELV